MDYEIVDLSARGPRRGLLCAVESIHPCRQAPPLSAVGISQSHPSVVQRARIQDHVLCALTEDGQILSVLCRKSGHAKGAVLGALRSLQAMGFASVQYTDRVHAFQRTQKRAQWRRTR